MVNILVLVKEKKEVINWQISNKEKEITAELQVFLDAHAEVLTAEWWRGIQERLREGELLEVLPYHRHRVRVFSSL